MKNYFTRLSNDWILRANNPFWKDNCLAVVALLKSPQKKAQILSHLVWHLSSNTKGKVFSSAGKKISLELGWPVISAKFKERVIHFLERPDISYCKPGRADTVYCGKNDSGDKIYKSKHHLLWTIQDMVELFNIENRLEKLSYCVIVQQCSKLLKMRNIYLK